MKDNTPSKILRIIFRIIFIPVVSAFLLIRLIREWITHIIAFARYGGEFIVYPDASTPKTVADVFNALVSLNEDDDEPQTQEEGLYRKLRDADDKEYYSLIQTER